MLAMDYYQGKDFIKNHVCGEPTGEGTICGKPLTTGYDKVLKEIVKCNTHPLSEKFREIETHSEAHNRGGAIDPYVGTALDRKREARIKNNEEIKDAGTNKALTPAQVTSLLDYAARYGLDIYRRHVCMMYGKPYTELDGLYFLAYKTKEFDGCNSRPMTIKEKADVGWDPDDYAWIAEIWRKGCSRPFAGTERVTQTKISARTDEGKIRYPMLQVIPDRMADKQAQRYALRAAFPDVMPEDPEGEGSDAAG